MPSLTIRNLPAGVHAALVRRAKAHGRSLNQEVLGILGREAFAEVVDPEEFIRGTREMHRRLGMKPIPNLEELLRRKREGLP
ncbi:MAG: Arc family DNA-binding protein [Planctomycetaceae bacterium]|nr:Arc family DNA-binding protein [Planctomycetota bacterium]NUN53654.1 Arc family DNA-binding protein [Planctomycetaceae bacterium]